MKHLLTVIALAGLIVSAAGGPPEPIPSLPELELEKLEALEEKMESLRIFDSLDIPVLNDFSMNKRLQTVLSKIEKGLNVMEINIGGDSITITLSNDSVLVFSDLGKDYVRKGGRDVLHVGDNTVIEMGETVHGDIISALGDITVKGTVDGSVMAFSGDIYVASTGTIYGTAVALSGKIKKEPGGRILGGDWVVKTPLPVREFRDYTPLRVMGVVLFIIFLVWMVLAATGASLFKKQVDIIVATMQSDAPMSFLKGYLAYILAFLAFVVTAITIIGIPLAILGVPLATFGGMILSFIAGSHILGRKILHSSDFSFKTYLYGSLAMGAVPGLFFLTLMITGNLVVMIFSWIFVLLLISVILPFGLGAVLSTRFGTRLPVRMKKTDNPE